MNTPFECRLEALKLLADIYNADSKKVEKAGILHDIAKNKPKLTIRN